MKILFSCSQSKSLIDDDDLFNSKELLFGDLYGYRKEILSKYQIYINSLSIEQLSDFFGIKDLDIVVKYRENINSKFAKKAVLRYDGVAYKVLDYKNLDIDAKKYIDNNLIIFSDLFGPILAKDKIPDYRLKQGAKIDNLIASSFYKKHFTDKLNDFCGSFVIDLRASYYEKFYKIDKNIEYITFKFLKNGKSVSHYAKKYRGIVLGELAKNNILTKKEILSYKFKTLNIVNKKVIDNMTQIICEVG